ncbi:MAG: hypothetical protein AAGA18_10785 [Verrucomicrobiota bacterium]
MSHTNDTLKFYTILYPLSALLLGTGFGYLIQQGTTEESLPKISLMPSTSYSRSSSSADLLYGRLSPFKSQTSITNGEEAKQAMHRALVANRLNSMEAQALLKWAKDNPRQALDFFLNETPAIRGSRLRNAAFEVILGQLGTDQIESQILNLKDKGRQKAMLRNLFAALASAQPREAFAFAQRHHTWADSLSIQKALTKIAAESPMEALKLSALIPSRAMQENARLAVTDRWGNDDPLAVLRWLENEPSPGLRAIMYTRALADLSRVNYGQAMQRVKAMTGFTEKREGLRALIKQQVMEDPANLFELIDDAGNAALRESIAGAMIEQLSLSPEVIQQMLERYDLQNAGADVTEAFIQREIFRDPQGTLAFIESLPERAREMQKTNWFIEIAKVDPSVGAKKMADLQVSDRYAGSIQGLAEMFTLYEPKEALTWANELKHSNIAESARYFALSRWAEVAPEEAAKNVTKLEKEVRHHAISYVGQAWAQSNPSEAIAWVQDSGSGNEIAAALGETIAVAAQQDFDLAREQFEILSKKEPQMLESPAAMTAAHRIGRAWEGDRLTEGAKWLETLPQGVVRKEGAAGLMQPLAEQGPEQLYEQLQDLTQPELKDAGLRLVARELMHSDLEGVYNIALEVSDESYRVDLLQTSLSTMMTKDSNVVMHILENDERLLPQDRDAVKRFLSLD